MSGGEARADLPTRLCFATTCKLAYAILAQHVFELEGTDIEDRQRAISFDAAARELLGTILIVDRQGGGVDAYGIGPAEKWLQIADFPTPQSGRTQRPFPVEEDAAAIVQARRDGCAGGKSASLNGYRTSFPDHGPALVTAAG